MQQPNSMSWLELLNISPLSARNPVVLFTGAAKKQKRKKTIPEDRAKMIQSKLKAALYGGGGSTASKFFDKYDKDRGGTLDAAEFKKAVRLGMKVAPSVLADDDLSVLISCVELS